MSLMKDGTVSYHNWNVDRLENHVKIYSQDYMTHYRLSNDEWKTVRRQFAEALRLLDA